MIAIARSHGLTLVQDLDDAYLPHMPLSAINADHVKGIYPLDALPAVLATLAGGGAVDGTIEKARKIDPSHTMPSAERRYLPLRGKRDLGDEHST
jgi:hypothetical protein